MATVASGGRKSVAERLSHRRSAPRRNRALGSWVRVAVAVVVLGALVGAPSAQGQLFTSSSLSANVSSVEERTVDLTLSYVPSVSGSSQEEPPSLDPETVSVFEGRDQLPAASRRLAADTLDVMVVADSYRSPPQHRAMLDAIAQFVESMPSGSRVGVIEASSRPRVALAPTTSDQAVLDASNRLEPSTEHSPIAGLGEALERFTPEPGRRRVIISFGVTYQYDQQTVDDVRAKLRTTNASIYVFTSDRSVAGSGVGTFPLPLGGGRASFGFDLERFVEVTVATLRGQLGVLVEVSGRSNPSRLTVRAQVGDEALSAQTMVRLSAAAEVPEAGAGSLRSRLLAVGLAVVALAVAVLLVSLPRLARARRARRASRSAPVPVLSAMARPESEPPAREPAPPVAWRRGLEPESRGATRPGLDHPSGGPAYDLAREPSSSIGGSQVEGRKAVGGLLRARARLVRSVWIAEGTWDDELMALATAARVPVHTVRPDVLAIASRSEAAEGVIAVAAPLFPTDLDELARRASAGGGSVIVVEGGVRSTELASLLRLAEEVAVLGLVLTRDRSAPISPAVAAAAEGAIEHVRVALVSSASAAVASLRLQGCQVVGVEAARATTPRMRSEPGPDPSNQGMALVLDGSGRIRGQMRSRCDAVMVVAPPPGGGGGIVALAQAGLAEIERLRQAIET